MNPEHGSGASHWFPCSADGVAIVCMDAWASGHPWTVFQSLSCVLDREADDRSTGKKIYIGKKKFKIQIKVYDGNY